MTETMEAIECDIGRKIMKMKRTLIVTVDQRVRPNIVESRLETVEKQ